MKNPTRHKIQEAEYFLLMIKQTFEDDDTFSYNLSAFLFAARSITFYMQEQYTYRKDFKKWYAPIQKKMSADSGLKYLNKVRVEDVHKKPVETNTTRETICDVANDFRMIKNVLLDRQIKQTKLDLSAQGGQKTEVIRRVFKNFKDEDIVKFCKDQLAKLSKLVEECEQRFYQYRLKV